MVDEPDKRFAFMRKGGPSVTRRQAITGGASTLARGAVRGAIGEAAEAPEIEEAREIGRTMLHHGSMKEEHIRQAFAGHPTLGKHVEHAVKAAKEAGDIHKKHFDFIKKTIY